VVTTTDRRHGAIDMPCPLPLAAKQSVTSSHAKIEI
jgi:hypothetical protein